MSLTVVLTNYRREASLHRIIAVLRNQTLAPTIFVWDNSPAQSFENAGIEWMIRSSRNAQCSARWWMAAHAQTDLVLIHDDDLAPADSNVLADTVKAAARAAPFAVGACGVVLNQSKSYWSSRHVGVRANAIEADTAVDIVKGFYICCLTSRVAAVGHIEIEAEDDILVSARLGNGFRRPHRVPLSLQGRFSFMPQGKFARSMRSTHRAARDTATARLFR